MKTKLVYVLTCAPEATYIEQALISIWSARYHNPDAHIVLIVDDETDKLFVDKRAEIIEYISEKIVVPFTDTALTPMYRSRFIKTQVRQLIEGDFLFIDCDTIIQSSLEEIDTISALVAMVPDEHMRVNEYPDSLRLPLAEITKKLGYDVLQEDWYFNSGVMLIKDHTDVHRLFCNWHEKWLEGIELGIKADQPSLGIVNIMSSHLIQRLPDIWNTLIYMNPVFAEKGKILHFWNFRNKSFIFANPFLIYLRKNGLTKYAKSCVLSPLKTVLPFDNVLARSNIFDYFRYARQVRKQRAEYALNVDPTFTNFPWPHNYSFIRRFIAINVLRKRNTSNVFFS